MVKPEDIEPTAEERANGWSVETLTEYRKQVEAGEYAMLMNRLFPAKPRIRIESCSGFDPHKWGSYDPHSY